MRKLTLVLLAWLPILAHADWEAISPGGATQCAYGTPYTFFVRKADPARVLVFFQGGGACWSSQNCDLKSRPSFDPFVGESDNPAANPHGIFDFDNPANPLADFTMLFVAYCSGDVHLGDVARDYPIRDETGYDKRLHIEHRGYANAMAALSWLASNTSPRQLVVAGASAGSIAAPFYGDWLGKRYPDADLVVFSDASGGYEARAVTNLLENWGTMRLARTELGYNERTLANLRFEDIAIAAAKHHGRMRFGQYNAAFDESQSFFLTQLGVTTPLAGHLKANEKIMARGMARFSSYLDNGRQHMVLEFDRFYEKRVDGISVASFLSMLVGGKSPGSVACDPCSINMEADDDA
ncbi:MAG: hypothetical protein KDI19_04360 [Pseudomonadales bacterium]|nr:hypothetical protein [Pseudomonadales bacterium]